MLSDLALVGLVALAIGLCVHAVSWYCALKPPRDVVVNADQFTAERQARLRRQQGRD